MTVKDFAEVGMGIAALYIVFCLAKTFLEGYFTEKAASRENPAGCDPNILDVIQNNTKVMDKLSDLMNKIITDQSRQEAKVDELLARAREQK